MWWTYPQILNVGLCAKVMEVNKDEEAIRLLCEFLVHLSKAIWEGRVILPGRRGSRSRIVSSQEDGGCLCTAQASAIDWYSTFRTGAHLALNIFSLTQPAAIRESSQLLNFWIRLGWTCLWGIVLTVDPEVPSLLWVVPFPRHVVLGCVSVSLR